MLPLDLFPGATTVHDPVRHHRDHLLQRALRALEDATGIRSTGDVHLDADGCGSVHLAFPGQPESDQPAVSYQAVVRESGRIDLDMGLNHGSNDNETQYQKLLILPRVNEARGLDLRQRGMAYLDAGGNAYLRGADHFILIAGMKAPDIGVAPGREAGVATTSALKVMFTVLCDPALLNAPYRHIAKAAGVALGAIGPILEDLARRRFTAGRKPDVQMADPRRLLDEWATNYPTRLRPRLRPRRFKAGLPDWRERLDLRASGGFWGGEIAADAYTHYLKPVRATIYLPPDPAKLTALVVSARLRPDPAGDIEILDAFWTMPADPDHPDLAPWVLVYADLLASLEPRNVEVARLLLHQQIVDAARDTRKAG